jgi:hypothetical protein
MGFLDPKPLTVAAGNATYAPVTGSANYAPATGSGTYETQSHAASTYATPAQAAGAAAGLAIVFGGL